MKQQADLANGNIKKLMISMAVPTITSQIVNMLYNLVDRIYIGHIPEVGDLAFAGVTVCFPIIMIISAFSYLTGVGGAPRASIAEGRGDVGESELILGNCLTMLLTVSAVLTVLFTCFARPILMSFGASDATIDYGVSYLQIYALGTLFVQFTLGMNAYITAQGFTKISMKTVLLGAILNMILDPIFIYGLGMGVSGAALATVISQFASALWVLRFLLSPQSKWRLRKQNMRLQKEVALPAVALGLSPFIMQSTESLVTVAFNTSLLRYGGDMAVGAMGALSSVMQFVIMPLQGLTQGVQPILSYNFGAQRTDRVRETFFLLLKISLAYTMIFCLIIQLWPGLFINLFLPSAEANAYGIWALRIYMAGMCIFGLQLACQQTFLALGDAKTSLFLAALRKIILLIPLIYILPNFFDDKAFAVFLAEPVADILAVTTTAIVFYKRFPVLLGEGKNPIDGHEK